MIVISLLSEILMTRYRSKSRDRIESSKTSSPLLVTWNFRQTDRVVSAGASKTYVLLPPTSSKRFHLVPAAENRIREGVVDILRGGSCSDCLPRIFPHLSGFKRTRNEVGYVSVATRKSSIAWGLHSVHNR